MGLVLEIYTTIPIGLFRIAFLFENIIDVYWRIYIDYKMVALLTGVSGVCSLVVEWNITAETKRDLGKWIWENVIQKIIYENIDNAFITFASIK